MPRKTSNTVFLTESTESTENLTVVGTLTPKNESVLHTGTGCCDTTSCCFQDSRLGSGSILIVPCLQKVSGFFRFCIEFRIENKKQTSPGGPKHRISRGPSKYNSTAQNILLRGTCYEGRPLRNCLLFQYSTVLQKNPKRSVYASKMYIHD